MSQRLGPYLSELHRTWLDDEAAPRWRELDASLLFFDISGFTPLTERLAKRGKAGVELLVELLNAVMDPLVDAAAALGGDTLKFGGDALLILFSGEGHERRACAAAHDMQQAMAAFRRRPTDAGVVSLRASSAVASGVVALFLVGDRFRELVVAGAVTSEVLALEHAAQAGEVRLGALTCAALERGCVAVRDDASGPVLAARPAVEPPRSAAQGNGDPARGLPAALHHHLGPAAESEHRQVTVGFAQFRGLDELLRRGGPPAAAAELGALMARVQRALDEHGVTFLQSDADRSAGKLFMVTGAPTASSGDEDRLLFAMRDVVAHDGELRVRAGVSRGRAFVVHLGSARRRCYTTMGDATNLAARIMGKAPDGHVLASDAVLECARAPFALTRVAPFAVKGKRVPVRAALVGELRAAASPGVVDSPLVGREAELRVLRDAVRCAREGDGRIVELVGEPGIGKSRLVAEVVANASATHGAPQIVVVESGAYGRSAPYLALRAPLRRLIAGEPASDEELADALARAVAEHLPEASAQLALVAIPFGLRLPAAAATTRLAGEVGRAQLHFFVDRLLAALLPARRTLLVVEDAHWLDEASDDLLRTVLRRAGERAWAVVVTRRPDEGRAGALEGVHHRIVVEALGTDAARALVVAGGGETLAPHVTAALVERSHGNPLFLRELVAAARSGAELDELPTTIEALLAARLDTLMPADRRLLRRAAVLGRSFPRAWLSGMLDVSGDDLRAALARLGDFLEVEPDRVRFRHMLLRDAAYEALPFGRRRALHARAGELIERELGVGNDQRADILALHFLRARDHVRAWSYALAAAEAARDRYAHADAAVLYGRALEAARGLTLPPREMSDVHEALGAAYAGSGQLARAHEAFTRARRLSAGDALRESHLMQLHARTSMDAGEVQRAARWLLRATRAVAGLDGPAAVAARAEIDCELAGVRARQGRMDEAITLCERVIGQDGVLDASLAHACYVLDWVLVESGRAAEAVHSQRALEIYRRLGDLDREAAVLNNLGMFAYYDGRWADAGRLYRAGAEVSTKAGNIGSAAFGDCNLGELRSDQGRTDEARRHLQRALEVWRATGYAWGVAFATTLLGRLEARAGHGALAEAHLRDALARFRQLRISPDALWVEALIPEARVFDGRPHDALGELDRLIAIAAAGRLAPLLFRARGIACAQLGRLDEASAALDASVAAARERCDEFELFLTLDVLCALAAQGGAADTARERDAIAARLDIAAPPPVPLAASVAARVY